MESTTKKVTDLIVNNKYQVIGFKSINTKFGPTYILKIKDKQTNEQFDMFSNPFIKKYVDEMKDQIPKGVGFEITKKDYGIEIDGYEKVTFTMF